MESMSDAEKLRAVAGWMDEFQNGGIHNGNKDTITSADLRRIADRLDIYDRDDKSLGYWTRVPIIREEVEGGDE